MIRSLLFQFAQMKQMRKYVLTYCRDVARSENLGGGASYNVGAKNLGGGASSKGGAKIWGAGMAEPPDFGRSDNGGGSAGAPHYYSPPKIFRHPWPEGPPRFRHPWPIVYRTLLTLWVEFLNNSRVSYFFVNSWIIFFAIKTDCRRIVQEVY